MNAHANPSFVVRYARWRRWAAVVVNAVVIAIACLFLGMLLYVAIGLALELPEYLAYRRGDADAPNDIITRIGWRLYEGFLWLPLVIYVALYVLPLVLTLPICVPIVTLWTDPPRFLVFRSFNHAQVTGPLRKVLKREAAPFGHVYTLSDADIKVPWFVRVPLLFG